MISKIGAFFSKILAFFSSGAANKALNTVAELVPYAIPFLDIAAEIAAGVAPSAVPQIVLDQIHTRFPRLFDGSLKTGDEVKLYLLAVAGQLLQSKYPNVSTSIARTAVQVAYTAQHA